jgi:hypothetical protein
LDPPAEKLWPLELPELPEELALPEELLAEELLVLEELVEPDLPLEPPPQAASAVAAKSTIHCLVNRCSMRKS